MVKIIKSYHFPTRDLNTLALFAFTRSYLRVLADGNGIILRLKQKCYSEKSYKVKNLIFVAERMLRYLSLYGIYCKMVIINDSCTKNLMTLSCTNPNPIQSPNNILFQFKEIKMPGHILKFIDRLAHIADNVYLQKVHSVL